MMLAWRVTTAWLIVGLGFTAAAAAQTSQAAGDVCSIDSRGARVLATRPLPHEPPIDDVNWFARPVPAGQGRSVVGMASHDRNYLYDLGTGRRVRIPGQSDAVATPDGRFVTVPSHYTSTHTVNFYDTRTLLSRLDQGRDAEDVAPVFAHDDAAVADVYYQSVGTLSSTDSRTVYRMMFSGSNVKPAPGFRIVDYTVSHAAGRFDVVASPAMQLCPQISRDLSTPFISKDGRYVIAHDGGGDGVPGTLKIFEIIATDPESRSTSCELRVDFGFAAGKADFSFDNRRVTFHISKHDYLVPFVNNGLNAPAITDVVVADLVRDARGRIVGHGALARVTTSTREGVGHYFPAFFPDGRIFYLSNAVPKNSGEPRRFTFTVVDPERDVRVSNFFLDPDVRHAAAAIGGLWRDACAPAMTPFKPGEAEWVLTSLSRRQCEALVANARDRQLPGQADLLRACRVVK